MSISSIPKVYGRHTGSVVFFRNTLYNLGIKCGLEGYAKGGLEDFVRKYKK